MKLSTAQMRTTLFNNEFVLEPTVRIAQEYLRFTEQKYYPHRLFNELMICKMCDAGDMEYLSMEEVLKDVNHYLNDNEYFMIMWTDDCNKDLTIVFEAVDRKSYTKYENKVKHWYERRVFWPLGK